ncbi:MAG: sulfotransferase [Bythopirellula sp.]|nr:sulfotransferase [Bythopirellula sp.]
MAKPARKRRSPFEASLWMGMDFFAWARLLGRNRFAIQWAKLPLAFFITIVAIGNTILRWLQTLWFGRRVRAVVVPDDPIFIIGHWRTGTTMLHELMSLDPRLRCPTTYECLSPNHFLLSEQVVRRFFRFVLPRKRPFDNVRMGFDRPQEDEAALCLRGQPSPFLTVAFPGRPPMDAAYIDLECLSPPQLARWKSRLLRFLQLLLFKRPGRLVLKSPQHTFRLKVLVEMFPRAKFIHIVRDPYVVYPSTIHFWRTMYETYGLQRFDPNTLREYVFKTFEQMHAKLTATRPLIDAANFYELRYEELSRDPVGQMEALYKFLELGDFDAIRRAVEQYAEQSKHYQTNDYPLDAPTRDEIARRWADYFEQYGYETNEISA